MISSTRSIRIEGRSGGASIEIDGKEMAAVTSGYELRHDAPGSPILTLHIAAQDITEINAEGTVRVLVGGQVFTQKDVEMIRAAGNCEDLCNPDLPCAADMFDLADRIEALLPPEAP